MRIVGKPVLFGVPVVMVTSLLTVLALWAWGPIGPVGPSSNASLVWNVEYWHRNADGEVLQHKRSHNAIAQSGLEHAMERLIAELDADATLAFANPAAAEIGAANAFDQILLMDTDDDTGDRDTANILLLVDGTNNGDSVHMNPADGTYTNVGSTTDGDGKVTVTFLAQGNPDAATQMQLVKAAPDDTASAGPVAVPAVDVLAIIEISVDLADTDTLQVDWTIDID